ncbi:hypothetical protein PoB_002049900 [Plakobranchus ocellatus]|uniref:Uncharacterized protein n=1 Tax=Plakobranchus ocellatus TaxID=259542 RepID=A0AAV3ZHW8_9GAST|nr:hypothetical protein PoB_002049900 [Plakobranchus ocellatus]
MCARIKEREYFKTCIVGHVNCCLQCAPTLRGVAIQQAVTLMPPISNSKCDHKILRFPLSVLRYIFEDLLSFQSYPTRRLVPPPLLSP